MSLISRKIRNEFLQRCENLPLGRLRLRTPEGHTHDFGNSGPEAEIVIHNWRVVTAMAARGDIGLGETYVAGMWDTSSIENLTALALRNIDHFRGFTHASPLNSVKYRIVDQLFRANSRQGSARNIKKHYDVGNEFYQLWLDSGMTYSSALFAGPDESLETAQERKHDRVLDLLGPGEGVLEIGCGWGSFAERAADRDRKVTGITISPSQKGYAEARLDGRAQIELCDYRAQTGRFDNIVSIEMVEAVGERYWPIFFAVLKNRLAEGGRAVLQAITVRESDFEGYRRGSDFIRRYTFPGGMLLSDATIAGQARQAGLAIRDNYAFGADYGRTCRMWAQRMRAQSKKIRELGHDREFLRSWLFYLEICAASFSVGRTSVVQVELSHAAE
ncbi:MAG: class I SAM-dependent methyltransferase [Rhodobacteraceae bacterium]|nr:class I SAM-dependent methyltransferase [Paracoccaceae bacterium]